MTALQTAWHPEPLWGLVEESLDEAQFLWRQWETGLSTHDRDLAGVSFWIEERLLGALDGLRVGEQATIDSLLAPALDAEDPFRATVAAHTLATMGGERCVDVLLTSLRTANGPKLAVLRRAIELSRCDDLLAEIERAVGDAGPRLAAVLWRIRGFQRVDPGQAVEYALSSEHADVRAAALSALRHVQLSSSMLDIQRNLERSLGSPEPGVRDTAIQTGLILGIPAAWTRCVELARSSAPGVGHALLLVAVLGVEQDRATVLAAIGDEAIRSEALFAAGFVGTRAALEACVQAMTDESLAKLAAEAFCAITGLDLERERLITVPPAEPNEPVPFEDEDLEADLVPKPQDLLPMPDVPGVLRWWTKHAARFAVGYRYLRGRPVDMLALQDALVRGPMRRRHAIALELAVRTGGRYQVETRAFIADQRRQMQSFELLAAHGARPRSPLARYFSPA